MKAKGGTVYVHDVDCASDALINFLIGLVQEQANINDVNSHVRYMFGARDDGPNGRISPIVSRLHRALSAADVALPSIAAASNRLDVEEQIRRAFERAKLQFAPRTFPARPSAAPRLPAVANDDGLVGQSEAVLKICEQIAQVSLANATVLMRGESGTGKELIARAIHRRSGRKTDAFVAVNCGALPETLLESELFGHERGAFTGAVAAKPGKFDRADRGTLFLDEVGEMSEAMQVKLLRVLQEHEFERVGGDKTIRVDVRVIAATHRDLEQAVAEGSFREDLYYRLNVFPLLAPPLRERIADLPLLAEHFVARYVRTRTIGLSESALECLMAYSWPGNIRELENCIERAVVLAGSEDAIDLRHLPDEIRLALPRGLPADQPAIENVQRLSMTGTSVSALAAHAHKLNGDMNGLDSDMMRLVSQAIRDGKGDIDVTSLVREVAAESRHSPRGIGASVEAMSSNAGGAGSEFDDPFRSAVLDVLAGQYAHFNAMRDTFRLPGFNPIPLALGVLTGLTYKPQLNKSELYSEKAFTRVHDESGRSGGDNRLFFTGIKATRVSQIDRAKKFSDQWPWNSPNGFECAVIPAVANVCSHELRGDMPFRFVVPAQIPSCCGKCSGFITCHGLEEPPEDSGVAVKPFGGEFIKTAARWLGVGAPAPQEN